MTVLLQTERQFQDAVVDYARTQGWMVAHFRNSMTAAGRHATAVAYDGAGFPDLVLVRDRVVFAELKSQRGRATGRQHMWLNELNAAGVETHLWRPSDWPDIERTLARSTR